jgi:hypothetical protein
MSFLKRRRIVLLASCLPAILAASVLRGAFSDGASALPLPAANGVLTPDKGSFRIIVNNRQIGKEQFEIRSDGANWVARGSAEVQTPDGATHVSGTLTLHADGAPAHYEWSTAGEKKASASIDFNNLTASMDVRLEGAKPYLQTLTFSTSPIVVLDNNLYHQYAILAHLYNREKKGPQTFAVLVPQELTPGAITVDSLGTEEVQGKTLEELTAKTEDLEVHLYLDNGRLVRITAPANNAEIVRE